MTTYSVVMTVLMIIFAVSTITLVRLHNEKCQEFKYLKNVNKAFKLESDHFAKEITYKNDEIARLKEEIARQRQLKLFFMERCNHFWSEKDNEKYCSTSDLATLKDNFEPYVEDLSKEIEAERSKNEKNTEGETDKN